MATAKMFVFDVEDLMQLCTHYWDGVIPLDAEVKSVGFNPYLQRFIGIEVESKEWNDFEPLHLRYSGSKVMSWSKSDKVDHPTWVQANDTPTRQ